MDPKDLLAKALHRTLFNAYKCGNKTVCKAVDDMPSEHRANIVNKLFADTVAQEGSMRNDADLQDPPDVTGVLHKDQQTPGDRAKSEITSLKQQNAEAALGVPPKKPEEKTSMVSVSAGAAAPAMAKEEPAKSPLTAKLEAFLAERNLSPKVQAFKDVVASPRVHVFKKECEAIMADKSSKVEVFRQKLEALKMGKSDKSKGVNKPKFEGSGVSEAGSDAMSAKGLANAGKKKTAEKRMESAKDAHRQTLAEIKAMPKPDLGKAEAKPALPKAGEKGVHKDIGSWSGNSKKQGVSSIGDAVRSKKPGRIEEAKWSLSHNLATIKKMPKPDLK